MGRGRISARDIDQIHMDPEKDKLARAAAEEAEIKKERKRKMMLERTSGGNGHSLSSAGMTASYLEEGLDGGGGGSGSLRAMKQNIANKFNRRREQEDRADGAAAARGSAREQRRKLSRSENIEVSVACLPHLSLVSFIHPPSSSHI